MFWNLTTLTFGAFALILFIFAFNRVAKGRMGAAIVFGVLGLAMASAAGSVAVYVD